MARHFTQWPEVDYSKVDFNVVFVNRLALDVLF